jgi:hypothetical protein
MSDSYALRFHMTAEDFDELGQLLYRKPNNRWLGLYWQLLRYTQRAVVILFGFLLGLLFCRFLPVPQFLEVPVVFLFVYLSWTLYRSSFSWGSRESAAATLTSPFLQAKVEWTITDHGLRTVGKHHDWMTQWTGVTDIIKGRTAIVLRIAGLGFALPFRAFPSEEKAQFAHGRMTEWMLEAKARSQ